MLSVLRLPAEWLRRASGASADRERPTGRNLFSTALWLGVTGFGGGISVLANIDDALVRRRRWLTPREYANTVTVAQMLPGGAAANALAYVGMRFDGWRGALAGYVGFVLPGFVSVLALAWVYAQFGSVPSADQLLAGCNAAVVGVIVAITLKMVRTSVAQLWQMGIAAGALLLSTVGSASPAEVVLLSIATGLAVDLGARPALARARGAVGFLPKAPVALPEDGTRLERAVDASADGGASSPFDESARPPRGEDPPRRARTPLVVGLLIAAGGLIHGRGLDAQLVEIAVVYFRTGLGAYGGGFAVIPHLKQMMASHAWITDRQFADAVAIGKLTPGPVLLLATFIGYLQHGWSGAVVATVAIFAAPFVLTCLLGQWLDRVRSRRWVRAALRGLTPAVVGLMAGAAITLGGQFTDKVEIGIAAATALTVVRFEVNPVWMLVLGGAARLGLAAIGV